MSEIFNRHEWLRRYSRLPGRRASKLVAVALWSFSNESGYCYPTLEQIANRIGYRSTSRISEHRREIEDAGFLQTKSKPGLQQWRHNVYQLVIPTTVGRNSPDTESNRTLDSHEGRPNTGELAPTKAGAFENQESNEPTMVGSTKEYGELVPTSVSPDKESRADFVADGKDTQTAPSWIEHK